MALTVAAVAGRLALIQASPVTPPQPTAVVWGSRQSQPIVDRLSSGKRESCRINGESISRINRRDITPKEEQAIHPDTAYFRSTLFFAASRSIKLCNWSFPSTCLSPV